MLPNFLNITKLFDINFSDLCQILKPYKTLIDKYNLNVHMTSTLLSYIFYQLEKRDRLYITRFDILPKYDLNFMNLNTDNKKQRFISGERCKLVKAIDELKTYLVDNQIFSEDEIQFFTGIETGKDNIFHFHLVVISTNCANWRIVEITKNNGEILKKIFGQYFDLSESESIKEKDKVDEGIDHILLKREGLNHLFNHFYTRVSYICKTHAKSEIKRLHIRPFQYTQFRNDRLTDDGRKITDVLKQYTKRIAKAFNALEPKGDQRMKDDAVKMKHYLSPFIDVGTPILNKISEIVLQQNLSMESISVLLAKIFIRLKQQLPLRLLKFRVYMDRFEDVSKVVTYLAFAISALRNLLRESDIQYIRTYNEYKDDTGEHRYLDMLLYTSGKDDCTTIATKFLEMIAIHTPKKFGKLTVEHDPTTDLIFYKRHEIFDKLITDIPDELLTYMHICQDMTQHMPMYGTKTIGRRKMQPISQSKEVDYSPSTVDGVQLSLLQLSKLIGKYMQAYKRLRERQATESRPSSAVS